MFDYESIEDEKLRATVRSTRAYGENVLYRRSRPEGRMLGNGVLHAPDSALDWPDHATLVSKGTGRTVNGNQIPATVAEAGDKVVVRQYEDLRSRIDPRTPEGKLFCLMRGNKVEGRYLNRPWKMTVDRLPAALRQKYTVRIPKKANAS